ncbi:unnamed protein product [Blepharisma stoltei]|uniref:Telomeric single stranded DNA binding POT1/Cdc13 domain-containing protein n=1 Tax=Blepharisma stoltei TaxID=1481888 RepID=A0AAU9I898_9CILI|nr:unnamed protein product [Blepharisma stoltei]
MQVSDLSVGYKEDRLNITIDQKAKLNEFVLRVTISDATGKINIIFEGQELVNIFDKVRPGTKLRLNYFIVSGDFHNLSKYFPSVVPMQNTLTYGTNSKFFIHIIIPTMPELTFTHNNTSISIFPDTVLESINLSKLYLPQQQNSALPQKLLGPNMEKFSSLKFIRDNIHENSKLSASCYALVVDSTSSYQYSESTEYLSTLKVTDPSIFPNVASISIFHEDPKILPKIIGFGDIIRMEQFIFKTHRDSLNGKLTFSDKNSKFYLFSLIDDNQIPYSSFRGNFEQAPEILNSLQAIRSWGKITLTNRVPMLPNSTKFLRELKPKDQSDILLRIFGVFSMGINEDDPKAIVGYDQDSICQIIVPREKEKLLKLIQSRDIIRVKDLIYENGRFSLGKSSDILKIYEFMNLWYIPVETSKEKELQNLAEIYLPQRSMTIKTEISASVKSSLLLKDYPSLSAMPLNETCKIEGFGVRIVPEEMNRFFCLNCEVSKPYEICQCGCITLITSDIFIYLWDGLNDEGIVKTVLTKENYQHFVQNLTWHQFKSAVIGFDGFLELGIKVTNVGYEIMETSLNFSK